MLESVFIFSLAIMFILVGLLLYHIRGRLNASEQRIDTLYEMTNKLTNEINATRVFAANLRYIGSGCAGGGGADEHAAAAETIVPFQPSPSISVKKIIVSDDEDECSDDDTSDDDSDGDESEGDSALDDGEYVSDGHVDIDIDNEPDVDIDITEISSEQSSPRDIPEEIEPVVSIEIVPDSEFEDTVATSEPEPEPDHEDYSKMNLPSLKKLAIERELASAHDISNMKKKEIVALLSGASAGGETA